MFEWALICNSPFDAGLFLVFLCCARGESSRHLTVLFVYDTIGEGQIKAGSWLQLKIT